MWIFCCGMRRSGSTVQFQITTKLVEEAGLGKGIEWQKPSKFYKLQKKYAAFPGWKVFKAHIRSDDMLAEFERGNAKGVYVYRDLRDVFVSTMRKYNLPFDDLLNSEFIDDCLRQYQNWTTLPGVLSSRYEDMMADMAGEVARIARHLDIEIEPNDCTRIAADFSIDKQKERIETATQNGDLRKGIANTLFDPKTNLHTNHIHSGAVGGWREVLTDEQAERIESKTGTWLIEHGYPSVLKHA